MEISANTIIRLIEYLESYACLLDNYNEIENVVHTVNFLEDERDRAAGKISDDLRRWIEWQETLPDFCRFLVEKYNYDREELEKARLDYEMISGVEKEEKIKKEEANNEEESYISLDKRISI